MAAFKCPSCTKQSTEDWRIVGFVAKPFADLNPAHASDRSLSAIVCPECGCSVGIIDVAQASAGRLDIGGGRDHVAIPEPGTVSFPEAVSVTHPGAPHTPKATVPR